MSQRYSLRQRIMNKLFHRLRATPYVQQKLDEKFQGVLDELEDKVRPYRGSHVTYARIPEQGRDRNDLLREMEEIKNAEAAKWQGGYVSGAVYHGQDEHVQLLSEVYALHSQSNPLHPDVWPSAAKYEAEIVAMCAQMLGAGEASDGTVSDQAICGVVSSGGTESILLAMKAYRDRARAEKGITRPEMIVPGTAHAAFDKAADYFNIRIVHVPVDEHFRADVAQTRQAITRNTIVIVGSAPSFPHGVIDPIAELSELARERDIGFHTDACLGGFVLPWARKLGYDVPAFDFALPGVTSVSVDTHKYGYAAKGTSVVLYRGAALRHYQYFTITDWPGGLYFSPTLAGSRPGALSAACWAALVTMGEEGYMQATRKILACAEKIKQAIGEISELKILGDALWVVALGSDELDIYQILDRLTARGWSLNGLHKPACIHLCVTLRHTQEGVAERFIQDLKQAVAETKSQPNAEGGMAPIYGMAATLPVRSVVSDLLKRYLDLLYKI